MSCDLGQIYIKSSGKILYFSYDGTIEQACNALFSEKDAVERNNLNNSCITDTHTLEDAEIAASYGGGLSWPGKVCLNCMKLVDGRDPNESGYTMETDFSGNDHKVYIRNVNEKLPDWWLF